MSQSPPPSDQPSIQEVPKPKRLHYTPELKLELIRLCINNAERYINEPAEVTFWQYMSALFKDVTNYQGADVCKKVASMVAECKATLDAQKTLSGVALPPVTDLEQTIDSWVVICERQAEMRDAIKSEASAEVKKEKAITEALRDNLTKRLSKKRDFRAVVDAREAVDLTAPGDIIQKRRHIRENLRANRNNDESKQTMRDNFNRLLEIFIDYMTKMTLSASNSASDTASNSTSNSISETASNAASPSAPPSDTVSNAASNAASPSAPPSNAASNAASSSAPPSIISTFNSTSNPASNAPSVAKFADLKEEMTSLKELMANQIKLLEELLTARPASA